MPNWGETIIGNGTRRAGERAWVALQPCRRNSIIGAVVGLCITAALALHLANKPGVFWSQTNVLVLAPQSAKYPNSLSVSSDSLIATAGVLGKMVGSSVGGPQVVSDTVTLVSEGVKHGYAVRLPDDGGQWAHNFDKPMLDVQAVGTSVAEVDSTINRVIAEIRADLARMQNRDKVAPVNIIHTRLSPPVPPVYYQSGSRIRAGAATLLLGTAITGSLVALSERSVARRRPARIFRVAPAP